MVCWCVVKCGIKYLELQCDLLKRNLTKKKLVWL